MTKNETSQSQQKSTAAAAGMPFAWGMENFSKMFGEQIARAEALMSELSTYENVAYERMKATAADVQTMTTESMAYATELTNIWRKAALEASQEAAKHFTGIFQSKVS